MLINIEKPYYVYVYCDQRHHEKFNYEKFSFLYKPFYVGSGHKNRYLSHVKYVMRHLENKEKLLSTNRHKNLIIKNIFLQLNEPPKISILEYFNTRKEAYAYEKYLVSLIGRECMHSGPLTNLTEGGDGVSNPSDETRYKIGSANRNRIKSENEMANISKGRQRTLYKTSGGNHWMTKEEYADSREVVIACWRSTQFKPGNVPHNAGKSYEEIYGEEKAKEIKAKIGNVSYETRSGANNWFAKTCLLINPNNEIIDFTGRMKSARVFKDGIPAPKIRELYTKKITEYKGWRLYEPTE